MRTSSAASVSGPKGPDLDIWCAAALALASLAVVASAPAQYLGRQQDDLLYIISAQALSRGSYGLFTSVGSPPLTMIHPGLPAILLPVALAAGENYGLYQAFSTLVMAIIPWVLWAWLKRRHEPLESALICLLFASSPIFLSQAGAVMSESPALLLTVALLFALEAPGRGMWAGFLAMAVTQVRPAGLSILPGVLARPAVEKRWERLAWSAAIPAAGLLLWGLWSHSSAGAMQKVEELGVSYAGGGWARPFSVALENARFYLSSWGASSLPTSLGVGSLGWLVGAMLAVFSIRGCLLLLRRDAADPVVWWLGAAAIMHALWPWQYERYLIPLLPFLIWTAALGLGRWARPALGMLLAGQLLFQSPRWLVGGTSWKHPELEQTYAWLRANKSPSDVLASTMHVRDGFYCGMPSLPLNPSPDPGEFAQLLKTHHARFVLWQEGVDLGLSLDDTAQVRGMLERASNHLETRELFEAIYANPREGSRIYRVK